MNALEKSIEALANASITTSSSITTLLGVIKALDARVVVLEAEAAARKLKDADADKREREKLYHKLG